MSETDVKRRAIRTRVQAAIAACTILLIVVPMVLGAVQGAVSPAVFGVLAGAAGLITALASVVVRVMSLPTVVAVIDKYFPWMSAAEPASVDELPAEPTTSMESDSPREPAQ